METANADGVVELKGTTASHPPILDADAVKTVGATAVTARLCDGGGLAPCWYENEIVSGVTVSAAVAPELTVSVTASVSDPFEDPLAVTVTVPLWTPAASPIGLTNMLRTVDVTPFMGLTNSQLPTLEAVAMKFSGAPLLYAVIVCGTGAAPPI